jgi:hypothetical protein
VHGGDPVSNRKRLPRAQNPASAILGALDGAQIPGGCDHCGAYQTVQAHAYGPDLHKITVHHDDRCPWYRARRRTP